MALLALESLHSTLVKPTKNTRANFASKKDVGSAARRTRNIYPFINVPGMPGPCPWITCLATGYSQYSESQFGACCLYRDPRNSYFPHRRTYFQGLFSSESRVAGAECLLALSRTFLGLPTSTLVISSSRRRWRLCEHQDVFGLLNNFAGFIRH